MPFLFHKQTRLFNFAGSWCIEDKRLEIPCSTCTQGYIFEIASIILNSEASTVCKEEGISIDKYQYTFTNLGQNFKFTV